MVASDGPDRPSATNCGNWSPVSLDAWEAEHGALSSAELAKAAAELALPKPETELAE